eukprot:TRINITY_DN9604_c0_g1_i1.p1 TRINITY_DN9604_c0_g1~~TRINITY_DN9604_c0_g1_i1.p1  ORF type:complete len:634 (-),score=58.24 TRINITY_DN9604_c0_g1_i1:265-2166(-)
MDKITRGSAVGDAHVDGYLNRSFPDTSATARGSHVSERSMKLDNTDVPRSMADDRFPVRHRRSQMPSDTFRSQDWMSHEERSPSKPTDASTVVSPRFWEGGSGGDTPMQSPRARALLGRSKSQKVFCSEQSPDARMPAGFVHRSSSQSVLPAGAFPRFAGEIRSAAEKRSHSPTYATSENWMAYSSPRQQKKTAELEQASPAQASPAQASPAPASPGPAAYPATASVCSNQPSLAETAVKRFSTEGVCLHGELRRRAASKDTMPSSQFHSSARRLHSGRITENSPHIGERFLHHELAPGEEPAPSIITNAVTGLHTKGKRVDLEKKSPRLPKKRLSADGYDLGPQTTQRRHMFGEHPHIDRLAPTSPRGGEAYFEEGSPMEKNTTNLQHQTSKDMRASLDHRNGIPGVTPQLFEVDKDDLEVPKFIVGERILSGNLAGKRLVDKCIKPVQSLPVSENCHPDGLPEPPQRIAAQAFSPRAAANGLVANGASSPRYIAAMRADNLAQRHQVYVARNLRSHRNSELVREHLQPMTYVPEPPPPAPCHRDYVPASIQSPVVVPPYRYVPHSPQMAFSKAEQRIQSFGELSSLPSNMPKDTAYLHSGLKVVKQGARCPGAFSPHYPRVLASQALGLTS